MAQHPMTVEQMRDAIKLVQQHGNVHAAARAANIPRPTLQSRYQRALGAAERGELGLEAVVPGFRISQITSTPQGDFIQQRPQKGPEFEIPEGHVVKGVSALLDADGREVIKWVKTKQGELDFDQLIATLNTAFGEVKSRPAIPAPRASAADQLAVYPLVDWHVGLMAWARETGENYDLDIARSTIMPVQKALIEATPPAAEAVVLGMGDLLHFDGFVAETPASKHPLDADGRYPKVLETAVDMVEETIKLVLARHKTVTVRILRGNHDPVSAVAVGMALRRVFRSNKRVTVDVDQSYHWWFRRGRVFLGASHGDKAKMRDLPMLMAHDRPEDWAASSYRKIFSGHIHHESRIEEGGVIVESLRTPVAKDAYHSFNRWRAGRSVYSETFRLDGSEAARVSFNL